MLYFNVDIKQFVVYYFNHSQRGRDLSRTKSKFVKSVQSGDLFGGCAGLPIKPIIDALRPVRVEQWRMDGLFRCPGVVGESARVRFVMFLRARTFDSPPREIGEVGSGERMIARDYIRAEKRINVFNQYFKHITDTGWRELMYRMICTENLRPAKATAREYKIPWPAFVADFNFALDEMITKSQRGKNER